MRSRTLERMRWLSVLCLVGAALCFALIERRAGAFEKDWADFPSPAPGAAVKAWIDLPEAAEYAIQMQMLLPTAARQEAHLPSLPPEPVGLHVSIEMTPGAARTIDIAELAPCSESPWSGIVTYCSPPFEMPPGRHDIEVSVTDDRLPPGRALSIVPVRVVSGFMIVQAFTRRLGWLAFAIGAALWIALAFARRYAPSDARR